MCHITTRLAALLFVATLAAASNQAQGQRAVLAITVSALPSAADEMERRAGDMLLERRRWDQAVDLYIRAAQERGAADERSADDLRTAGYLQFYRGRGESSVAALTRAAEIYLALGDVERAADTFIDGAWVGRHAGMAQKAMDLGARASLLTGSPLLGAAARAALAARLGSAPASE